MVARLVLIVTFGSAGSMAGWWLRPVSAPQPAQYAYSSARPKAVWPISCSADLVRAGRQ